ncbi:SID1 transmembrane family member 1-like [Epargyreus clarus]|uniref:SID1 transmembrane family member 1-like n=1 Tax=Epargyreus clarus TaxID=520877 RepID=UPI003C2E8CAE
MCVVCRALLLLAAAGAGPRPAGAGPQGEWPATPPPRGVVVVQKRLPYDVEHHLPLNNSLEYILEFIPPPNSEGEGPSRVWVRSDGGDAARPVLVTVRQRAGAETWQLPYAWDGARLRELERALCPDDTALGGSDTSACAGEFLDAHVSARGAFSLHISSACAAPLLVRVRVALPSVWWLPFDTPVHLVATPTAPQVFHYRFPDDQDSVRLVVASDDEVCASISVQNYTCPIGQTLTDIDTLGNLRMTVMRSGAVQLSRQQFPAGFYVVALVWSSDARCGGAAAADGDWLWQAALFGDAAAAPAAPARTKRLAFTVRGALSRAQYAVAAAATLALFLLFYVAFGALVLAQRWPACARHVRPRAVLAPSAPSAHAPDTPRVVEEARSPGSDSADTATTRRRRGSDATFDSSDGSDTDSEEEAYTNGTVTTVTTATTGTTTASVAGQTSPDASADAQAMQQTQLDGTQAGAFGLPARLRLAALARRRGATLRARSDRYLHTLATVAVFYALPGVQLIVAFQIVLNVSGSLDICYYNFLCAHPAGALSDFNHVLSNLGYLLLGGLFLLQVRRRRRRRKREPRHEEYGIPAHYGLLSALGVGMMVVAVLSASYHVCPNRLNFQFDTAFMYVLAVLSMVKIYQSRHPDVNARAHATFGVLAVLIAIVVWGVLGGGALFWGVFSVLHVFTFLLLSLRIYYVGQFRLEKESVAEAARELRKGLQPLYSTRLVMLLIGNAVNWLFAIYGLLTQTSDFAGHLLQVLLCNALLYMVFYLAMKLVHGERLRWYAWLLLGGAAACWAPALYFFLAGSSDWSATPALSRHRNHECKILEFYDSHDLWHLLSAAALYLSFSAMLTWDDGLSAVKRTEIPVF